MNVIKRSVQVFIVCWASLQKDTHFIQKHDLVTQSEQLMTIRTRQRIASWKRF